jgi:hypothetical protein
MRLHTEAFTQSFFGHRGPFTRQFLHADTLTHRHVYT